MNGPPPGSIPPAKPAPLRSLVKSLLISTTLGSAIFYGCPIVNKAITEGHRTEYVDAKVVATFGNWGGSTTTFELPEGRRVRWAGTWGQVGDTVKLRRYVHTGEIVGP